MVKVANHSFSQLTTEPFVTFKRYIIAHKVDGKMKESSWSKSKSRVPQFKITKSNHTVIY